MLPRVPDIDAPLLLMHGMAADNVLFTHSLKLIKSCKTAASVRTDDLPKRQASPPRTNLATHHYNYILGFFRRELMA